MNKRLDTRITLQQFTDDYSTGDLVRTNTGTKQFWGDVKEIKSPATSSGRSSFTQVGNRLRDHKIIVITARSRAVSDVAIGSELTLAGRSDTWIVTDIYDVERNRYVDLIAEARG